MSTPEASGVLIHAISCNHMDRARHRFVIQQIAGLLPFRLLQQLESSEIVHRFLKLASWTTISFALDKAAILIIVFLLARILGAQDYGRLTLTQGLVSTTQVFVVLGSGTMLARYIPAMREDGMRRAVEIINLCALVVLSTAIAFTLVGLFNAPGIARTMLDLPSSSPLPYWILGWVLFTVTGNLLMTVMLSFEKGRAMGLVALLGGIVSLVATPLLSLQMGLTGAVIALTSVEAAKMTLLVLFYVRLVKGAGANILTPPHRGDTPLLWRFGLPAFLNSALWAPTLWLAQFIVKTRAPDGLTAVGVFGFTNSLMGAVILISSLTNQAALPIQASLHARGEFNKLRRFSGLLSASQIGLAAIIAIPTALAAPLIMAKAGADFAPHWPLMLLMVAVAVVIAGQTAIGNYLLVNHRPYFLAMTMAAWSAMLLGSAITFAPYGAYALAGGLLAASILRSSLFYLGWIKLTGTASMIS